MFPPSRGAAVALLFVGAVALLMAPATGLASQDGSPDQDDPAIGENPSVSFVAEAQMDGDARWNVTTTVSLETDEEIAAYRSTASDFEDGELTAPGYEAFEAGLADVNRQTEREMALTAVTRNTSTEAEIDNGVGRFTLEFTWENFMRETQDGLVIDRAVLVMEDGTLWLPGLDESQTLTIVAPPGYGIRDSSTGAQNGRLQWSGPESFDETALMTRFVGSGEMNNPDEPTERSGIFPWLLIPIAAIGIAIAVFLSRTDQIELDLPADLDVTEALSTGAAGPTAADTTDDSSTDSSTDDSTDQSDGELDTELLSDEERVERLLSSNGGRMKQADIVKETDWSNAKVSQLLSSMEEKGQIDKLRIGRENLISFPDKDVTDSEE